jgi:HlyD family secretion protein
MVFPFGPFIRGCTVHIMRLRLTILAGATLGTMGVAAAILAVHPPTRPAVAAATVGAPAAPAATAVAALGRVEPQSEIINLGAGGLGGAPQDKLEALLVDRGDPVTKGQELGHLAGRTEQIAQRNYLRAQLEEAKAKFKTETALDQQHIADSETHLQQVLQVEPQQIAAQEANVRALETTLADHEDVLNINSQLYPKGFASRRQRDGQEATVREDRARLESGQAQLAQLKRQFEFDRRSGQIQIDVAKATLARAQADFPLESLAKQIELDETRANNLTLYSPINGRVLNVLVRPGENVGTGPVLTLGDTSKMRVVAEVYETDIGRVELGERSTITSRALAQPLGGKVVRIGDMVFKNDVLHTDPAAKTDARIVQVWIELDDAAPLQSLTNLTVDVVIGDPNAPSETNKIATSTPR